METAWTYGVVAFIDVLGFSNFVESDARSLEPVHLARLRSSLEEVRSAARGLDIRAFSDSIIISTNLSSRGIAELFTNVARLQRIFVRRSVLVRGAIAFGKHFADSELIYSEALVRAYIEERDHARFPRILVNKDLLDWILHDSETTPEIRSHIRALLLIDRDNRVFLNYLIAEDLETHLELLHKYGGDDISASVLEKIQWLAEFHNYIASKEKSSTSFDGALLTGFRNLEEVA